MTRRHRTAGRIGLSTLTALLLLATSGSAPVQAGITSLTPTSLGGEDELLLAVQPGTDMTDLAADYGVSLHGNVKDTNLYRVSVPRAEKLNVVEQLMKEPRLLRLEADGPVGTPESATSINGDPVHVPFEFSTRLVAFATTLPLSLLSDAVNGDDLGQTHVTQAQRITLGEGVTVAVLDTGVDATHPYLAGKLVPGYDALAPDTAPDEEATGLTNVAYGHGTMVAGIIARVAPGAKILPIRVLNADGSGDVFALIAGIRYAVAHGAQVINLSLGGSSRSCFLEEALTEARLAGCVVVAAAGNDNSDTPYYPAALSGVLGVTALDGANRKASFSNYGLTVSLGAPGVAIRSSFPGGSYASWSGTSFATPFVSGTAALAIAADPSQPRWKITQRIWNSSTNINRFNSGFSNLLGRGLLNAEMVVISR